MLSLSYRSLKQIDSQKVKNPDLKLGCDHLAFCYLDIPFYQFSSINFYFHIWLTFQTYNWWRRNETNNSWKFRLWFEKQSRSNVRRIDPYSSLTLGRRGRGGVWQSLAAWVCQWLSNGQEWNSYLQKSSPQVRPSAIYTQVFQIFCRIWISSWSCDLRVSS